METKAKKLYGYINTLSFSEVINLYNILSQSIANETGVDKYEMMYDYTLQDEAEIILRIVGVEKFLCKLTTKKPEERAFFYGDNELCYYFCNPWEEFMKRADEFIAFIEYYGNDKCFNKLYNVIFGTKVKVAIKRYITNVVEVQATNHVDALDYVVKHLEKFDPMNVDRNCIIVSKAHLEVLPN